MASRTKKPISFKRHQEIGIMLRKIRGELMRLSIETANAYPVNGTKGRAFRALGKAQQYVGIARSALEDSLFKDYPDQSSTHVYYGEDTVDGVPLKEVIVEL